MYRPRYTVQLRQAGTIPRTLSARVLSGNISTTRNGYADASITLDVPSIREQQHLYAHTAGSPGELLIAAHGRTIYHGRIESVTLRSARSCDLVAVGFQNAYRDVPYTALWSTTSYENFQPATELQAITGTTNPDRYTIDINNRIYMSPIKGTTYTGSDLALVSWAPPHNGVQSDLYVTFDYEAKLPTASWFSYAGFANDDFTGYTSKWTLAGSGAVQTGSQSFNQVGTGKTRFVLGIQPGAGTPAGESGAWYLRITNIRIKTTSNSTVTADTIVKALASFVAGINSSQASAVATLIDSPGVDLKEETYEDMIPADILDKLGKLGDNDPNPQLYDWAVWDNKILQFLKRGTYNRTWMIDADDLEVTRNAADVVNSTYATYQDVAGRTLRTTVQTDDTIALVAGIVRRQPVSAQTTSSLQADITAEALLRDRSRPQARAALQVHRAFNPQGGSLAPCYIQGGDVIKIRNIPSILQNLDGVQSYNVLRTDHDLETGIMTITPDAPAPLLEMLLARREEMIR